MPKRTKRRRHFRHLNQFDRDRIEALLQAGHKQKEIAGILNVDKGTISREIQKRKLKNGCYKAAVAHQKARVKRLNSKYQGMKIEKYPALKHLIITGLKEYRSPDEIAGRMKKEKLKIRINTNAIYKWLYSVWGQSYCRYLCTKRYRKKKQKRLPKRGMIPNRISLKQRPKGGIHAEGDLFVSPIKSKVQRSGTVVCVSLTQLLLGQMVKNKKPAIVAGAIRKITNNGNILIDDLILDNGIENKLHQQFGLPTYFADPHSPWQKPHIENGIGLLRRWFIPKKTNLKNISNHHLKKCLHVLNGKYRRSLGYRNAYEVSIERGIIQKIPDIKFGENLREKVAFHCRI